MRELDYHKLAARTWDDEFLSYVAQIVSLPNRLVRPKCHFGTLGKTVGQLFYTPKVQKYKK